MYDKYNEIMPKRIRELIAEKKVTQNAIATEIGVTRQAISQYCDGSTIPNADKLLKLSQYFNVSADYLLGETDAKTNDKDIQAICDYTGLNEKVITALAEKEVPNYLALLLNLLSESNQIVYLCKVMLNYFKSEKLDIRGSNSFKFGNIDSFANSTELNWLFYKAVNQNGETIVSTQKIDNTFWDNYFLMEIQKTLITTKKEINQNDNK